MVKRSLYQAPEFIEPSTYFAGGWGDSTRRTIYGSAQDDRLRVSFRWVWRLFRSHDL